jgi:hypothetical protein
MTDENPEDRSQHENLMRMAKMTRDRAIADGIELGSASLEEIAEVLRDHLLPDHGLKAKGYTRTH